MPATLPLLLVSTMLAVAAVWQARQHRRRPALRAVPAAGCQVPTLVRTGRIGDAAQPDPVRSTARLAPAETPDAAAEIVRIDGSVLAEVRAGDVVMARGWSRGQVVLAFGESRREYGPAWALSRDLAGWELQLVEASGRVVRCYGAPGSDVDDDLDRLRDRISVAALPQAG